jgi:OTU domain-containing protein 6
LYPSLQEEYTKQLEEMKQRHVEELAIYTTQPNEEEEEMIESVVETNKEDDDDVKKEMKERKQNKARRKREQERLKQKQLEAEQERDLAGPSARKEELAQIQLTLQPLGLEIIPVVSDGHCLYRAVANQVENKDYRELRKLYIYCIVYCLKTQFLF